MKVNFRFTVPAAIPAEIVMQTDFLMRPEVPPFRFPDDSSLTAHRAVQILQLNRSYPDSEGHTGKVSNCPNLDGFAHGDNAKRNFRQPCGAISHQRKSAGSGTLL